MQFIKSFLTSFPTATIIYILLVALTSLQFEWPWFIFAVVIDLVDDVVGNL